MCIFMCMGGNSTTWMNTAILVTCIRNFRNNRGPVSGILKGYVGLSTAIFTDLCNALFANSPAEFLMMLSVIPFAVCVIAMFFLREVSPSSTPAEVSEESKYFGWFNILAVMVAVYLLAYDFIGSKGHAFNISFTVILLAFLASPLLIPSYMALKNWLDSKEKVDIEDLSGETALDQEGECDVQVKEEVDESVVEGVSVNEEVKKLQPVIRENNTIIQASVVEGVSVNEEVKKSQPVLGEEHTIIEAFKTIDFWVLFVSFLCGAGTGLTVMNNMGQMGAALGYKDVSMFVSLLSIMGFFGRIISGTVSEYCIKKAAIPRPFFNAASQILNAIGYIIMAMAIPGSLYVGSAIIGLCYGVRLAVTVPTASELFGLKYYGLIYNILILNLPLGSFLFSGLLAGLLYDSQATVMPSGRNECYGAHCYRLCFLVMGGACLVGFILDVFMGMRTREIYRKISASKTSKD